MSNAVHARPFVPNVFGPAFARALCTSVRASGSASRTRTFLGVSLGVTASAITLSVIVWPLADVIIGPRIIYWALEERSRLVDQSSRDAAPDADKMDALLGAGRPGGSVAVVVCSDREEASRVAKEYATTRPCVYVTLREATSPHELFLQLVDSIYSPLPAARRTIACMGVYWLILFDFVMGDHDHVRKLNLSVILRQLRCSLQLAASRTPSATGHPLPVRVVQPGDGRGSGLRLRPLVVVDNLHVPLLKGQDDPALRGMVAQITQFLCAVTFDEDLVDVLIVLPDTRALRSRHTERFSSSETLSCGVHARRFRSSTAFEEALLLSDGQTSHTRSKLASLLQWL